LNYQRKGNASNRGVGATSSFQDKALNIFKSSFRGGFTSITPVFRGAILVTIPFLYDDIPDDVFKAE